ncbi:MAG: hypothetical protein GPJ51_12480 [Candidatus Heimdallarchaeota archaeon]|nr:hypothetical protein [Candidatus Heimdallarchaeota archaeon]
MKSPCSVIIISFLILTFYGKLQEELRFRIDLLNNSDKYIDFEFSKPWFHSIGMSAFKVQYYELLQEDSD